jgi:heme exporter protein C
VKSSQLAFYVLTAAASFLTLAALGLAFFYAPTELTMGVVQKIFYSHVPAAMCAYAGFTVASAASMGYLLRPRAGLDAVARAGVEVGLLFCVYVLISGPIWGYKAWGKAWVWDPQLTATFVLFLMYGGYFLLRVFSPPGERIRKIASALAVFAVVNIPIVHYSVKKWGGGGLAPAMKTTFGVSMLAFLLLFAVLIWLSIRVKMRETRVEELYLDVEDLSRSRS